MVFYTSSPAGDRGEQPNLENDTERKKRARITKTAKIPKSEFDTKVLNKGLNVRV